MAALTLPGPLVSFRHVRVGAIGAGGRLPPGWEGERIDHLAVDELTSIEGHSTIVVKAGFSGRKADPFVSLILGPFINAKPNDLFVLACKLNLLDCRGVVEAFLIVREWVANGAFRRQATRPLSLSSEEQAVMVGLEVRDPGRVLQPVLTLKRVIEDAEGFFAAQFRAVSFTNIHS